MLPPVELDRADGDGQDTCLICGKSLTTGGRQVWIVLSEQCGSIVDPATPEPTGGCFLIGTGCSMRLGLNKYRLERKVPDADGMDTD